MKISIALTLIVGFASRAYGFECFSCNDGSLSSFSNGFDGENYKTGNCFRTNGSTSISQCSSPSYCITQFDIRDGIVTGVSRGCQSSFTDEDITTNNMPGRNKCVTNLSPSLVSKDRTSCYYHCNNSDKCNSKTTETLKTCSSNCGRPSNRGYCDYIIGSCVCGSSYTGADCSGDAATPTPRSCVQCNSATDSDCNSTTITGSDCPGGEKYCSSAQTWIYDTNFNVVSSLLTRGCTDRFQEVDECTFTDIYNDDGISNNGYSEYTCYSTCETDNCNTNNPDGVLNGNEQATLRCVQCTGSGGDCNEERTLCPTSATHCKATVEYLVSERNDMNYQKDPAVKTVKVVRECATEAVTQQCTKSTVQLPNLKKITCQETCQTHGCNTGWPARPVCLSCDSHSSISNGYDRCLENPYPPTTCSDPHMAYCYLEDNGIREGQIAAVQGYPRRIIRGCSYYDRGSGCSTQTIRGVNIQQCNYTCTTDGCNVGSGSTRLLQNVIAIALSIVFAWAAEMNS